MTTCTLVVLAAFVSVTPSISVAQTNSMAADERTIRDLWVTYERAWNKHDAASLANLYLEDGDVVFPSGKVGRGRAEVEEAEKQNHATVNRASTSTRTIHTLRFIAPTVAIVDGSVEITGRVDVNGNPAPSVSGALQTLIFVKNNGVWRIAAARAMIPSAAPQQPALPK